jgi:hypothetical protein
MGSSLLEFAEFADKTLHRACFPLDAKLIDLLCLVPAASTLKPSSVLFVV